jgi:hypothetical protein
MKRELFQVSVQFSEAVNGSVFDEIGRVCIVQNNLNEPEQGTYAQNMSSVFRL